MDIGSSFTTRYAFALTLVACTLIVSHLVSVKRIGAITTDARTINISGMQRMLSQRSALLARELSLAEEAETRRLLSDKLVGTLDRMEANNAELSAEWRTRAAAGEQAFIALVAEDGLDRKVRHYISWGRLMRETVAGNDYSPAFPDDEVADHLAAIARNGFLAELDAVVRLYERDSVTKTHAIGRIGTLTTLVGLSLLLLEVLFIFRPMARRITSTLTDHERSNGRLTEANEELAQFNYRISHDIVAPISTARGYLDCAIEEIAEGDLREVPYLLTTARGQLDRLDVLVADLSDLALASADETHRVSIALEPLFDELRDDHVEATLDGLFIRSSLDLESIDSDPVRIRQMLSNLVDNATKYRDTAEAAPLVLVSSRREGGNAIIEVSDNGIGIDPEFGARAFDMFARGCSTVPGTGLGLYIIDKHAGRLGARLSIESHGKPTVFRITLPDAPRLAA